MAKKVLYTRFLTISSWPAAAEFEDISDDEFDHQPFSDYVNLQRVPLDYSSKSSSSSSDCDEVEINVKEEYVEEEAVNIKQEPVVEEINFYDLRVKDEPMDDHEEESNLVIDTRESDERLLQEWNNENKEAKEMVNAKIEAEETDDFETLIRKAQLYLASTDVSSSSPSPTKRKKSSTSSSTTSTEQFNCQLCTRKYWKFSKLKDHIKSIHGKRQKTEKSNNKFGTTRGKCEIDKRNLVSQCPECGDQLQTKTEMFVHRLTHIIPGFSSMKCPLCGESQHCWSNMKKHMQCQHKILEKWFCPVCPDCRTFTQNHSLLIHISTFHFDVNKTAPAQYPCERCNKTFTSKALLGKHINIDHITKGDIKMVSPEKQVTPRKELFSTKILDFTNCTTPPPPPVATKHSNFTISSILSRA